MIERKTIIAALGVGTLAATAAAQQAVNIDFEGATAGDATYVGDDGALSSVGGTTWNSVIVTGPASVSGLDDEFGNSTPVGVNLAQPPFPNTDPASTNVLEDSGIGSSFAVTGLLPNETYTVVGYVMVNGGFAVTDANGNQGFQGFGFDPPQYNLPGVQGGPNADGDYMRFDGLVPFDIGGGIFGIEVSLDGTITGFQIRGRVPTPATVMLGGIAGLAGLTRRRR